MPVTRCDLRHYIAAQGNHAPSLCLRTEAPPLATCLWAERNANGHRELTYALSSEAVLPYGNTFTAHRSSIEPSAEDLWAEPWTPGPRKGGNPPVPDRQESHLPRHRPQFFLRWKLSCRRNRSSPGTFWVWLYFGGMGVLPMCMFPDANHGRDARPTIGHSFEACSARASESTND